MRKIIGFFCLLCVFSCQEPLVDSLPRFMREQNRSSRAQKEPEDTSARPHLKPIELPVIITSVYATALHFRDSVNWRLDSLGGAEVLLFKDGELVQRQEVASPPDPERHRIWNGQLWTDYTDGNETVLLCDGVERFRFAGEEQLRGFLLVDGDVHTLGQHPGKGGFCYRINGEAVFSRDKGSVLGSPSSQAWRGGALNQDGNNIYYSYRVDNDYHVMRGAETFRVIPAGASSALYDLRVHGGHLWRAEKRSGSLVLVCDEQVKTLNVTASTVVACRLVPSGDDVLIQGCQKLGPDTYSYWTAPFDTGTPSTHGTGYSPLSELCYLFPHTLFANVDAGGRVHILYRNHSDLGVPRAVYTCPSALNLFLSNNHYAAALTHNGAGPHLLVHDGQKTSLSFNGYFTSVIIE